MSRPIFPLCNRLADAARKGCACVFAAFMVTSMWAHDPGLSTAELIAAHNRLVVTVSFAPTDAAGLLPLRERRPGELRPSDEVWRKFATSWCEVDRSGVALVPSTVRVIANTRDTLRFQLEFAWHGASAGRLVLRRIGELPVGHRQFALVQDKAGNVTAKGFLDRDSPALAFTLAGGGTATSGAPAARAGAAPFLSFVRLGVEHIWTGYDHLLFLFALIIVCQSFRAMATIISSFTVAHSITLAAATLNLVNLPPRFVEPAIAASIVFVAVENLVRGGVSTRARAALTFAFGLIHGFGFASALRNLGIAGSGVGIGVPLLAFNVGVELGQMVIAAVALPIVWQLRHREFFVQRCIPAASAGVGLAGMYWLVVRTVLA